MSVAVCVFLNPARMVTSRVWAEAIKANGFDMSFDADFDARSSFGFVPCKHQGKNAGFEYSYQVHEGAELQQHGIGDPSRPTRIMMETGSDYRQFASSVVAAGVLCAITDAVLLDPDTEELVNSANALAWARGREADCVNDIARQEN